jgi:hypothetical protein
LLQLLLEITVAADPYAFPLVAAPTAIGDYRCR